MTAPDHWRKYPRTFHHPLSPGVGSDDKVAADLSRLEGAEVVITEKMDGENTTLYRDGFHARSLDSGFHASRSWLAAFHARIADRIPDGWRLCGENLFARHSVAYAELPDHFLAFGVWNDDRCLPHDETMAWLAERGIAAVPELWRGYLTPVALNRVIDRIDTGRQEGFVIRTTAGFDRDDFAWHVVKWVRPGHVATDRHWSKSPLVRNGLREQGAA